MDQAKHLLPLEVHSDQLGPRNQRHNVGKKVFIKKQETERSWKDRRFLIFSRSERLVIIIIICSDYLLSSAVGSSVLWHRTFITSRTSWTHLSSLDWSHWIRQSPCFCVIMKMSPMRLISDLIWTAQISIPLIPTILSWNTYLIQAPVWMISDSLTLVKIFRVIARWWLCRLLCMWSLDSHLQATLLSGVYACPNTAFIKSTIPWMSRFKQACILSL